MALILSTRDKPIPNTPVDEFGDMDVMDVLNTAVSDKLHSTTQDLKNQQFALDQHAIVSIADLNGDILYVNDRFCQTSGRARSELLGENLRIISSGHHDPALFQALWQTISAGQVWKGELQNRKKDGSLYWVDITIVPLPGVDGLPEQYISISTDISAQKLLANNLRISEERIAFAMEGSGDGVWDWDLEHDTVLFSRQWKEMLGYREDEIGADITEWSTRVHPEDFPAVMAAVEACQDGNTKSFSAEHRMRCKDGSYLWVLDRGMVVSHGADGLPLRLVATHSDITQFRKALAEAQAANNAKSRFLATMSHEIRTPLNGVLGMAQLLLQPELSVDKRLDFVRTILSSGQVLLSLLNDILDLSKIESGKFQFSPTEFEPAAVLTQTGALFSGAAHTKGLHMAHQWQGPPGQHYLCDAHRLHQMLSNLVGNAIKFTPHGSVQLSAREVQRDGSSALLEFSVRDTGIGVAKDKLGLLFKPFSQADSSTTREFGGSGLGLSIVSRLAQAMGGSVGVESEAGTGSRFWFRVRAEPITHEKAAEQDKTWSAKFSGSEEPQIAGHVLVAEDDPINAKLIAIILRTLGLQMSLTTNGQQVADAIMHNTLGDAGAAPDLILMDMQMPVLNGQQAAQRIRQWEADHDKPRIPIIALTANAFEEDRQQCLAAGMDAFLTKPVSINALKDALMPWLPAPRTGLAALDGAAFTTLMDELLPMLAKNKFAALARFKALQALTAGTALAQDVDALAAPMQDMKFALVRERLLTLANSHAITPACENPKNETN